MKKLFVLALTGMFAFAVTAQTTAPAAGKTSPEKQPVKMESKKEAPAKKDASATKTEPMKKEAAKKEAPKAEPKKDASKMEPKKENKSKKPKEAPTQENVLEVK